MFAERIKLIRKNKKMTQREFADKFNISSGTIAMWETGKREPDFKTLCKIADYFNCTTDYLLGRTNDPGDKKITVSSEDDTVGYVISKDMPELTPEEVKELKEFLHQRRS